jgi:alkylation response protein AidB-like acyl-CoA dehydrogenase
MDPAIFKAAVELGMPLDAIPAAHGGYLEGPYSQINRAMRIDMLSRADAGITYQLESATDVALAIGRASESVQKTWFAKLTASEYATAAILGANDGFTAKKGDKGLLLSGSQTAVLLAESATVWLVKAAGPEGTLLALFAGKPSGSEVSKVSNTGFRACDAADVHMTDIAVPADGILAQGTEADEIWQAVLDSSRLAAAAMGTGNALGAVDFAQGYADERVQFGRPIAKFQAIAQMIEESKVAIEAARLLAFQLAFRLDQGEKVSNEIRLAKAHVSKVSSRATIDGVQVLGGYGFVADYPVEKHYRDARVVETLHGRDMLDILIGIQAA